MFTDDLREELESALVSQGRGITDVDLVSEILDRIEDAIYDHGYVKVYSKEDAQLEYLEYLDGTYDLFVIDSLEIKASDIIKNLPGDTFNNMMTRFIAVARDGVIK